MGKSGRSDRGDEVGAAKLATTVLIISSSDEEEPNSMRRRPAEGDLGGAGSAAAAPAVIDLSSSSDDEAGASRSRSAAGGGGEAPAPAPAELEMRKKRKKKTKKKKEKVDVVGIQQGPLGTVTSVITEVNEASNNVLRKLLRGPRYFDLGTSNWETCYNCGEEGHMAADCTAEKKQKPCFVCGLFGHNAKQCMRAADCFVCKRRGHLAKECPDKHKKIDQDAKFCLQCGDLGHDMLSCWNSYDPDDLKEIQCYICKTVGHLCCVDFVDGGPSEVSCYNCAQFGHTGLGCAKLQGESSAVASPTLCYKCGEAGHFARGCKKNAKSGKWVGELSVPTWKVAKESRDHLGSRSVPYDFGGGHKKQSLQHERRQNKTTNRSRPKGGWIVDDPDDMPYKKPKSHGWVASSPSERKRHVVYSSDSGGRYSSSLSHRKHRPFHGTPTSRSSSGTYQKGFSASRLGSLRGHSGRF